MKSRGCYKNSFLCFPGVRGGEHEKKLLSELLATENYNILERPVANEKETLRVSFGLTLMQIIDVVRRGAVSGEAEIVQA